MIILILISMWNSLEERKANQKIDELMQKVKLLTIIAHTECDDLPNRWDTPEFKIASLERKLRNLEFFLLSRIYQEKDISDNQESQ